MRDQHFLQYPWTPARSVCLSRAAMTVAVHEAREIKPISALSDARTAEERKVSVRGMNDTPENTPPYPLRLLLRPLNVTFMWHGITRAAPALTVAMAKD